MKAMVLLKAMVLFQRMLPPSREQRSVPAGAFRKCVALLDQKSGTALFALALAPASHRLHLWKPTI